ncbi:MAG TPA: hemolysin family protein [Candidatus Hydrogenedentes bacterium]|nr:hemolysin family protein [Candidatus Hydrogenedentota bacterium]HQE81629.1 hemolysin family protein [Candidatus Hydrogenedentota bacterium]HQH52128.1 hemolysin family protein [Candidatus Hydrogenedentota bacterium]HQM50206.1 hemolysin family protein [Candidatus Hydrogenedentota bacterium]
MGEKTHVDDDAGPYPSTRAKVLGALVAVAFLGVLFIGFPAGWSAGAAVSGEPADTVAFTDFLPVPVLVCVAVLLGLSAFFSGSETAFFSIHRLRLRAISEEETISGRFITNMMKSPGRLLTTILVGNTTVNVLISVLLGTRVQRYFEHAFGWSTPLAYPVAVAACTGVLVFFGEISPKIVAVGASETLARLFALPLSLADRVLAPLRNTLLRLTDLLFRVTRFHELRAAPFITDEELKAALSTGESHGAIESGERQMIQGILEFTDTKLREVLTPRPDVVALPSNATVKEALEAYRENEYSRMPVFEEDMDHIRGVIVMKDLLPAIAKGDTARLASDFLRPPLFVPETMTVPQFVRHAQQRRTHLGIVVDEYGGTAGIVTLEDAVEEVVGDIMDEDEQELPPYERVAQNVYRVDGGLPLDELSEILKIKLEDEEHETVAGFLMKMSDRILQPGDEIEHYGVRFVVERCDGKRVESVRIEMTPAPDRTDAAQEGAPQ